MEPGRLLASGRDGDIFEFGPGLVLRKTKDGRVIEREARTIAYAYEHGYPVPKIHDVRAGGTEIVMDRIDGPMMMDAMLKQPWRIGHFARALADLHDQLHVIPAPDWVTDMGGDDRLVHLDLHPMNVMLASNGPIVIDWTNAARGNALLDVAVTIVLLTCPQMPGSRAINRAVQPLRALIARSFAARYDRHALDEQLVAATELQRLNPNFTTVERAACIRLGERAQARVNR